MKTIEWNLTKKQKANIFKKDRKISIEGSAGSGKTIFAATKTIFYCLSHAKARAYVFRQTLTSLKKTSFIEVKQLLEKYNIPFDLNKAEIVITFPNGSTITFLGLDDLKKIRSINADFIWVEQAEETSEPVYRELEKRLRGEISKKYYGQLILTVTPEEKTHWIYEEYHRRKRGEVIHFHYTDNTYLPKEFVAEYEDLKEIDYELYVKYTLGKWGKLTSLIYENWDVKLSKKGYTYYTGAVDFGFNNPSAFLLIAWYDGEPYILDEVYQSRLTNGELIDQVKECLEDHGLNPQILDTLYCDSAEPDRIEEFSQAGFNAVPAEKPVNAGIDTVKRVKIHISDSCNETKKEIKSYKWKKDKDGELTDIPVKFKDHAMDALRYCIYGEIGALSSTKHDDDDYKVYVY